jgi:cytidine deaminase
MFVLRGSDMFGNENDHKKYNPKELDPNVYVLKAKNYFPDDITRQALFTAMLASQNTYSPYSKFPVGAAVVTDKGIIYHGCNVENASYGITLCAERNAITTMIAECGPKAKIHEVVIYTPTELPSAPCGACRQVIREFAFDLDNCVVVSYAIDPKTKPIIMTVNEMLPESFGPENL